MQKVYVTACAAISLAVFHNARSLPAQPQNAMPTSAAVYRIDPAQSELHLLVGHSSRIGHNHVITNRHLSGEVHFTGDASTSSFTLTIPVNDFDVDDPAARSEEARGEEGSEYAKTVSPDDRSDTKGHMLSPELLDGSQFAQITLRSTAITATAGGYTATMEVKVAGHQSTFMVPFVLDKPAGQLSASGTVTLRQTDLGLKPMSFMMGVIVVKDEIAVKFKLVATAT